VEKSRRRLALKEPDSEIPVPRKVEVQILSSVDVPTIAQETAEVVSGL
jgi:hypothetical protein